MSLWVKNAVWKIMRSLFRPATLLFSSIELQAVCEMFGGSDCEHQSYGAEVLF